ncbi:nitroreductase family protein [Magnetococcus sp. PR-3]|uniref:nitroreductase family protein n=1 Tax=Magnetococcus sp. PR-3 TaxID=3120355 RepID=UPI002FCE0998
MDSVRHYHQQTKHRTDRYAASPEFMDWDTQPNPFRHYAGAPRFELPLSAMQREVPFTVAHQPHGQHPPEPITPTTIAGLMGLSLGLAAWKVVPNTDQRWALRCNPSSGNLHPTEGYVVIPVLQDAQLTLPAGVYHYHSYDHVLEQRAAVPQNEAWLSAEQDGFVVGLSSIFWREMWKYGERAYRYCQLDIGHAIAGFRYAAAAMGWTVQVLDGVGDATLTRLLGLPCNALTKGEPEPEHPDLLLWVSTSGQGAQEAQDRMHTWAETAETAGWFGQPNLLSPRQMHQWPVVDDVAQGATRPDRSITLQGITASSTPPLATGPCEEPLDRIIYQRRSAQQFDGKTSVSQEAFYRMLDALLPRPGVAPWDSQTWPVGIHPLFFVHRVEGLEPGMYLMVRHPQAEHVLRETLSDDHHWSKPEGCPAHLPLYHMVGGDVKMAAMIISCKQSIAGDSAFSLGMLAQWEQGLKIGPWHYRNMFWEAGMLGQVLYLEAEAEGVRGTGIGCYFDDLFHERAAGFEGTILQSLYHFTVGGAVEDTRLSTEPPYGHLKRE